MEMGKIWEQENGDGCKNLKKKEKRISELRYLASKRYSSS
jgi:hypothetical protein